MACREVMAGASIHHTLKVSRNLWWVCATPNRCEIDVPESPTQFAVARVGLGSGKTGVGSTHMRATVQTSIATGGKLFRSSYYLPAWTETSPSNPGLHTAEVTHVEVGKQLRP
jgi:hypothetical protein